MSLAHNPGGADAVIGHLTAHLVLLHEVGGRSATPHLSNQQCARQEEASCQPICFLLLVRVASEESKVTDSLNLLYRMLQEEVGEFVGNIAVLSTLTGERIPNDNAPVGELEGAGGEGARLQGVDLFQAFDSD